MENKRQILEECWSEYKFLKSCNDLLTNLQKLPSSKEKDEIIKRVMLCLSYDIPSSKNQQTSLTLDASFSSADLPEGVAVDSMTAIQRGEYPPFIRKN